jgi:copper(I)-binding protein
MKKILALFLLCTLLLSACGSVQEEESGVETHQPWARAAAKGENGVVYLILHNHTLNADELTGASTDVAESVEIHESKMDANGVMTMEAQSSVPLAPDAEIEFKPGGLHFMLVNLKQELKVGDKISLTLHFKNHEDISIAIPVMDASEMGGDNMDMP